MRDDEIKINCIIVDEMEELNQKKYTHTQPAKMSEEKSEANLSFISDVIESMR